MSSIVSPHDKIFKYAMSDIRVAREFFENYLPEEIKQSVNLDKLELYPKSYIDENLKSSESDILYKTQIADETAYLYLLAEHQSTPDPLMAFRLLKYIVSIWADHLKQSGGKKLPLVIPVVFYHGREPYTYTKDIRDLIAAPRGLIEKTLFAPFQLVDTHEIPDEALRKQHWFGVMAFFMKHIFVRDFIPYLKAVMADLKALEAENGAEYIVTLLNYVLAAGETGKVEDFVEAVKQGLSSETGEKVMTMAEQLIARGEQAGMQRGILQCGHEVLMRQLKRKFGAVPEHYQKRIEQAGVSEIYEWSENLIDARTLDEVFQS